MDDEVIGRIDGRSGVEYHALRRIGLAQFGQKRLNVADGHLQSAQAGTSFPDQLCHASIQHRGGFLGQSTATRTRTLADLRPC
ncbi:hypothetical protein SD37_15430 [Amycolatopsis orientalis]|uniref:Uncharacterized protein n=1 Tax=Amycolatopsis orientalis TaxID=31958 RepID=A0A193BXK1_AMYOR|nr:hypothetical protein SD37_15430 [Amycolatopsis orientalis]